MGQSDLLPMSFGIIADGREDVERILDANGAALGERLQFVHGRVEMGLRVSWNVPNIFEYFVSTHPELRDLRDRLFQGGAVPSPDDKIELGRRFDRALQVDRALCLRKVVGLIESACFAIKENEPRTECDVMSLACLVDHDGQEAFEECVFQAAERFDSNFAFDFNGPWPPYTFAQVSLEV